MGDVNKFPISYYSSQYMILSHLAENTQMFSFVPQNPIPKKKNLAVWGYFWNSQFDGVNLNSINIIKTIIAITLYVLESNTCHRQKGGVVCINMDQSNVQKIKNCLFQK